jgi:protein involved in polysaccharide export with SLBB domain
MIRHSAAEGSPSKPGRGASGVLRCLCAGVALLLAGCSDRVRQPSAEELAAFQTADATGPAVDMDRVLQAKVALGPYVAVAGDVLQVEMPGFLEQQVPGGAPNTRQIYNCRIADDGAIVLPTVGPVPVAGKSLAQIESTIAAQYYPKYVAAPLPVYVSVQEYRTRRVSILGAVAQPGIHALRHDQMSLVALLMQAGGIVPQGAAVIRINRARPGTSGPIAVVAPNPSLPHGAHPADQSVRAVFEREGPLRTTGWLTLQEQGGKISARRWLDVGNEPQRRAFLGAVAPASKWPGARDLGTKLSRLAVYLDSRPQEHQPPATIQIAGWRMTDDGRFVTAMQDRMEEGDPLRGTTAAGTLPHQNRDPTQTLVLPVRGLNIPFADVVLDEGDTVVVEGPREQSVAIVGLVNRPGTMPYPPGARYTLIQAVAFAGGLNVAADPWYISVYRLTPQGEIVSVTFQLVNPRREQQLTEALALPLIPGDVVSVEHTPRTRTNIFFDKFFRVNFGFYVTPEALWNGD